METMMREAVAAAAGTLPAARRRAVEAVLGWTGPQATLVEAAQLAGVSRETVRRDRDRVAARLADDPAIAEAAGEVVALVEGAGTGHLLALAAKAADLNLVDDTRAFEAVLTTLAATGHLGAVVHSTDQGGSNLEVDEDLGAARSARALLDTGLPARPSTPEQRDGVAELAARGEARWLEPERRWAARAALDVAQSSGGRAVRRLLAMTGPLTWADVLAAWARAGGKSPYEPLPTRTDVLDAWVDGVPGLALDAPGGPVRVVDPPVHLDRTSHFLRSALAAAPAGRSRAELLEDAEREGLRRSGVAAILSYHPALISPQRGLWALRSGTHQAPAGASVTEAQVAAARARAPRPRKARPTTFTWSPDGELVLEFSVPTGPSPVIAVPRVVSPMLDGARMPVRTSHGEPAGELAVRDARAWGFGPALNQLGLRPGDRAEMTCDLVAGAVTVAPVTPKEGTPR